MSNTCYIYGLKSSTNSDIRYVGKTIDMQLRLKNHIRDAKIKKYPNSKCHNWIRKVIMDGGYIEIVHIYTVSPHEKWQDLEKKYISEYRKLYDLTNTADGGEGGYLYKNTGVNHSQYRRGERGFTPWNVGVSHTDETKNKIRNHPKVVKWGDKNGNWGNGDKISGLRNFMSTPIRITNTATNDIQVFETRSSVSKYLNISERQVDNRIRNLCHDGYKYEKISKDEAINFLKINSNK